MPYWAKRDKLQKEIEINFKMLNFILAIDALKFAQKWKNVAKFG